MQFLYAPSRIRQLVMSCLVAAVFLLLYSGAAVAEEIITRDNVKENKDAPFQDISINDYYYPYIKFLYSKKILAGFPDATFRPETSLTRAQVAATLATALGYNAEDAGKDQVYKDVSESHWAYKQIQMTSSKGLLKGDPDGKFRPDDFISRAEAAVLLFKFAGKAPEETSGIAISDVSTSHWAYAYIASSIDANILPYKAEKDFSPDLPASRAEWARGLTLVMNLSPALRQVPLTALLLIKEPGVAVTSGGNTAVPKKDEKIYLEAGDIVNTNAGIAEIICDDGTGIMIENDTQLTLVSKKGISYLKSDGTQGTAVDYLELKIDRGKIFSSLATKLDTGTQAENNTTGSRNIKKEYLQVASNQNIYQLLAANQSTASLPWYKETSAKRVKLKVDMPWGVCAVKGTTISIEVSINGASSVSCYQGEVSISSSSGDEVDVTEGEATSITDESSPPAPPQEQTEEQKQQLIQVVDWYTERVQEQLTNQLTTVDPQEPVQVNISVNPQADVPEEVQKAIQEAVVNVVKETLTEMGFQDTVVESVITNIQAPPASQPPVEQKPVEQKVDDGNSNSSNNGSNEDSLFSEDFESDSSGLQATGLWHVVANNSGIRNNAAGTYVKLPAGDESKGSIPNTPFGNKCLWYGRSVSEDVYAQGNYINAHDAQDYWMSGGLSSRAHAGSATTAAFTVPASINGTVPMLNFSSWWEIESMNSARYDCMYVFVVVNGVKTQLARLNPGDIKGAAENLPYTSGGFNVPGVWRSYSYSLAEYQGKKIQICFQFGSTDKLYNGFRGWFLDHIYVSNSVPATTVNQLKVEPVDSLISLAEDNSTIDGSDNIWVFQIQNGTLKDIISANDLTITSQAVGLEVNPSIAKGDNNNLIITLQGSVTGAAYGEDYIPVNIVVKSSAVIETAAADSGTVVAFIKPQAQEVVETKETKFSGFIYSREYLQ